MKDLFEKSYDIVKDAMKDVKHEICITLEDGTAHIVFVHDIKILDNGSVSVDWSTMSEGKNDILWPHVIKCVEGLVESARTKVLSRKPFSF